MEYLPISAYNSLLTTNFFLNDEIHFESKNKYNNSNQPAVQLVEILPKNDKISKKPNKKSELIIFSNPKLKLDTFLRISSKLYTYTTVLNTRFSFSHTPKISSIVSRVLSSLSNQVKKTKKKLKEQQQ